MGKKTKEHRKKVARRNEEIKTQEKRLKKAQQDFLMQMIEREKAAGMFDNNMHSGPVIDIGIPSGPMI